VEKYTHRKRNAASSKRIIGLNNLFLSLSGQIAFRVFNLILTHFGSIGSSLPSSRSKSFVAEVGFHGALVDHDNLGEITLGTFFKCCCDPVVGEVDDSPHASDISAEKAKTEECFRFQ
jgi:hypothetical protein